MRQGEVARVEWLDRVICGDSRHVLRQIPDESVHLTFTSPPYNANVPYASYNDTLPWSVYRRRLRDVWQEVQRLTVPGGRLIVNIAGNGRDPYLPVHHWLAADIRRAGWYPRGEIIWYKGGSRRNSTAWGSWCSPSGPCLRDTHEYLLVFSKGEKPLSLEGCPKPDITSTQFIEWTQSVWRMDPVMPYQRGVNPCPAPFPAGLAERGIKLYTAPEMTVLDPFMGGGTTPIAARTYGRHYVGVDLDPASCRYAAFALGCDVVDLREAHHAD